MQSRQIKLPQRFNVQKFKIQSKQKLNPLKLKSLQNHFQNLKIKIQNVQAHNNVVLAKIRKKINWTSGQVPHHSSLDPNQIPTLKNKNKKKIRQRSQENKFSTSENICNQNQQLKTKQKIKPQEKIINQKQSSDNGPRIELHCIKKSQSKQQIDHLFVERYHKSNKLYQSVNVSPLKTQRSKNLQKLTYGQFPQPEHHQNYGAVNVDSLGIHSLPTNNQNSESINELLQIYQDNLSALLQNLQNIISVQIGNISQSLSSLNPKINSLELKTKKFAKMSSRSVSNRKMLGQLVDKLQQLQQQKIAIQSSLQQKNREIEDRNQKILGMKNQIDKYKKQKNQDKKQIKQLIDDVKQKQKIVIDMKKQHQRQLKQIVEIYQNNVRKFDDNNLNLSLSQQSQLSFEQAVTQSNNNNKILESLKTKLDQLQHKKTEYKNELSQQKKLSKQKQTELLIQNQLIIELKNNDKIARENKKQWYQRQQELMEYVNKIDEQHRYRLEEEKDKLAKKYQEIVDKLNTQLRDYVEKYNTGKKQINDLLTKIEKQDNNRQITSLKQQITNLQKQLIDCRTTHANILQQQTKKQKQHPFSQQNAIDLHSLQQQIHRYQQILAKKQHQLHQHSQKYHTAIAQLQQLQQTTKNISMLKKQNQVLQLRYKRIQKQLQLQKQKKDKLKKQIIRNNDKLSTKIQENQQLHHQLYLKAVRIKQLEQDNNILNQQEQHQKQTNEERNHQNDNQVALVEYRYQKILNGKQEELKQHRNNYHNMVQQLTNQLKTKTNQLAKYEINFTNNVNTLNEQIKYLQVEVLENKKQNEKLQKIIKQCNYNDGNQHALFLEKINEQQINNEDSLHVEDIDDKMLQEGLLQQRIEIDRKTITEKLPNNTPPNQQIQNQKNSTTTTKNGNLFLAALDHNVNNSSSIKPKQPKEPIQILLKKPQTQTPSLRIPSSSGTPTPEHCHEYDQIYAKYQLMVQEKDKQLYGYIEKFNKQKQALTDQLDTKSQMIHIIKHQMQKIIKLLKQQNQIRQKQILQMKQQIQLQRTEMGVIKRSNQKIKSKMSLTNQQLSKMTLQVIEKKDQLSQMEQLLKIRISENLMLTTEIEQSRNQNKKLKKIIDEINNDKDGQMMQLIQKYDEERQNWKKISQKKQQIIRQLTKFVKKEEIKNKNIEQTDKQQEYDNKINEKQLLEDIETHHKQIEIQIIYGKQHQNELMNQQEEQKDKKNKLNNQKVSKTTMSNNNDNQATFANLQSENQNLLNQILPKTEQQNNLTNNNNNTNNNYLAPSSNSNHPKNPQQLNYLIQQNSQLNTKIEQLRDEIKHLLQAQELEEQLHEKQFMNQSQIYKKQLIKQRQKVDNLNFCLSSLKKMYEHMLDILLNDHSQLSDFEECIDNYQKICNINQSKDIQLLRQHKVKFRIRKQMQQSKPEHQQKKSLPKQQFKQQEERSKTKQKQKQKKQKQKQKNQKRCF